MKKVIIVAEGNWGDRKPGDYDKEIKNYYDIINGAEVRDFDSHEPGKMKKAAQVEIANTSEQAEKRLSEEKVDVVIFISRGMVDVAKKIAAENSQTRVIILSGLIPEKEIIWIEKGWVLGIKELQEIFLNTSTI